jgi:tRNA threonylcarbamoyl adenosine modification protein YeaZ
MKILALEFSSAQRSVALVQKGPNGTACLSEVIESGGRAVRAIAAIEQVLPQAQVEREQVDCLAVGLGPGSYNGIRAAIALAQGWQLAREVKLLGVSSVEAIAVQAQAEGLKGLVQVVVDAQRNEFYWAVYETEGEQPREVQSLRLATFAEVSAAVASGVMVGPEVTRWFPNGRVVVPRAATVGELALGRSDFVPGEKLEPIYLRETTFVKAPPPRVLP